jgi:hypothetical protein
MPAAENHAVFVIYIYVGPAAKPQAAPIAPESRRVVDVKLMILRDLGESQHGARSLGSLLVVGEGILFGDDGRWSEPLTTLLRSAQSRVSSGAPLDVACEDTPPLPAQIWKSAPQERVSERAITPRARDINCRAESRTAAQSRACYLRAERLARWQTGKEGGSRRRRRLA